eukprot:3567319-Alexandrium_andersonii.AAC.1
MDPLRLDGGQPARGYIVPTRPGPCRGLAGPPGGHLRRMPCAPRAGTHYVIGWPRTWTTDRRPSGASMKKKLDK